MRMTGFVFTLFTFLACNRLNCCLSAGSSLGYAVSAEEQAAKPAADHSKDDVEDHAKQIEDH